ncbi:MAG: DUF4097 family beta strand repeat-containing protein, partial [Bacteroidota bacterium]
MKNFIKHLSSISLILFLTISLSAQADYKVKITVGGKVIINQVDKVNIEGYDGTEVIISGVDKKRKQDPRAAGLRVISGSGKVDNTGLGLSAIKAGNELTVEQVGKNTKGRFMIKIPHGISVLYEHDDHSADDLNIRNFKSEIEISAHYNEVKLDNVTGPMSINTVHGDVDARFSKVSQANPITIRSSHGLIDIAMPASTKANLKVKASHGDMFTDFDISKKIPAQQTKGGQGSGNSWEAECDDCDDDKMEGTINGGGVLVDLHSSHGN